jgi:hypothetical protein
MQAKVLAMVSFQRKIVPETWIPQESLLFFLLKQNETATVSCTSPLIFFISGPVATYFVPDD